MYTLIIIIGIYCRCTIGYVTFYCSHIYNNSRVWITQISRGNKNKFNFIDLYIFRFFTYYKYVLLKNTTRTRKLNHINSLFRLDVK